MATTKANIDVSVTGQAQLDRLQTSMARVNEVFAKFKAVIAGAAFAGFARGALQMADAVQDLADVTGIAADRILALQQAVQFGGGSMEGASKGVLTFYQTLNEAVGGSAKAQAAFVGLGISLQDLGSLSEQDLLNRTLEALAEMAPSAEKAALQGEILGKSMRGVTINRAFIDNLRAGGEEANKVAQSIQRAADLNEQFERGLFNLRLSFLEAFAPMLKMLGDMLELVPKLTVAFKILGVAIATALAITGARALVGILGMIGRGVAVLQKGFGAIGNAIKSIGTGSSQSLGKLRDLVTALVAPVVALATAWGLFSDSNDDATKKTEENTQATDDNNAAQEAAARHQREVTSAIASKVQALQAATRAFAEQNARTADQINLENSLLGKSKQYADTVRAQEALIARSTDEINKLRDAKAALSDEERALGLGAEYDRQIAKIQELTDAETQRIERLIANQSRLQAAEQLRLYGIQTQIDQQRQLQNIQDDIAKINLTEIEKKYYDIEAAARASAVAAIQAEEARRGEPLSEDEVRKYYEAAVKGSNKLRAATRQLWEQSRTFAAGWRRAFNEYVDNARNAAATAERLFSKFTTGLEDALVELARTGKFEWRGLLDSMLEELLRSQIRNTLASLGSALGLGGLFGSSGGGGNTPGTSPSNPMYVVQVGGAGNNFMGMGGQLAQNAGFGQSGGGLISGGGIGGGILSSIGNVFSGVTNTIGNIASGVFDAVGSIGSTIGSFFDGFFANGGQIGAGKFGVVGERGPEFVAGPATVTPMGGSTAVTYNINAVDAASFKAMIAADPSFIYAVTEQGRRGVPARR